MPPFPQSLQRVKAHGVPSGPTGAPVLPESVLCISSGWPDSSRGEGWSLPQGLSHQATQDVSFVHRDSGGCEHGWEPWDRGATELAVSKAEKLLWAMDRWAQLSECKRKGTWPVVLNGAALRRTLKT